MGSQGVLGKGQYQTIANITIQSLITANEEEKDGKRWWNQDGIGFDEV